MGGNTKPWVDGPFQLISPSITGDEVNNRATGAARLAAEMSFVHNTFLRGINAIYLQCVNVGERGTPKDKLDFANFARQWAKYLDQHHSMEEEDIFPSINEEIGVPGFMDGCVEEHAAFHDGAAHYEEYLDGVIAGKEEFDGKKLKNIIDSFMPVLATHLTNEIKSLMGLAKWEDKVNWPEWFEKKVAKHSEKLLSLPDFKTDIIPLAIIFHHRAYANGVWAWFPPIPWFVHLMLRWLYVPTHKDWWRFAGCDDHSNPKELPFA